MGGSYPSAEMQSVYSKAPPYWANRMLRTSNKIISAFFMETAQLDSVDYIP